MKRKALLVGARASFQGPWVHLEGGEWVIDPTHSLRGGFELEIRDAKHEVEISEDARWLRVFGPCSIRASVHSDYAGPDIHLDVEQVSHA